MSPYNFRWDSSSSKYSYVFVVRGSDYPGHLDYSNITVTHGVRPEISLVYWKVHRKL